MKNRSKHLPTDHAATTAHLFFKQNEILNKITKLKCLERFDGC